LKLKIPEEMKGRQKIFVKEEEVLKTMKKNL
jgi:hypothetical protein